MSVSLYLSLSLCVCVFLSSSIAMRSELYWRPHTLSDTYPPLDVGPPVGHELQQNEIAFQAMCVYAKVSGLQPPDKFHMNMHAGFVNGFASCVRPTRLFVQSGVTSCRGSRAVENVTLDALNVLCLNAPQGFLVLESSLISSLSQGYDKFRVSDAVREETHTILFPFNADQVHWFMVVLRKALFFDPEVSST